MKQPSLPKPSWLSQLGLALTSTLVIVAGFTIASVLFAVLLIAGLAAGGWLWWQYRKLVRRARDTRPDFLEGEYVIEPTPAPLEDRRTPLACPPENRDAPAARRAP
ncbi:MAG: hypothetical protein ABTR20_04965 [Candidatus Competibacter sp.]